MKKTELIRTIENLFWENSFSDLSMDMIAQKLGMKKPSLYYHFPSKEAMFLEVLEQSFEIYKVFLEGSLERENVEEMIAEMVLFPLQSKNLFAIASQKGYCQMDDIRKFIEERYRELEKEKLEICQYRFGWNTARTKLFFALIESLSKKACLENCEGERKEEIIGEIRELFFGE
ncbi:MAG: helix-turn-helix domain-containing protein [Candidatus Gracilibacteria bacterium]|jgi:AcrR family transcriptional regulator